MSTMEDEPSPDAHKRRVLYFSPITAILEETVSWNG